MGEKRTSTSFGGVTWGKKWGMPSNMNPNKGMYIMLGHMDTCYYCGKSYHPMPVFVKGNQSIHVCHPRITMNTCRDQAVADRWEYRRDLTPSR